MKRAFTMMEILVAIAIIVIVVAIALPVLFRSKDSASRTVCTSNLHQLTLAMQLYREDHGDYPLNDAREPAFRVYYPTMLRCPQSIHAREPNLRFLDYQMMGSVIGTSALLSARAGSYDAFLTCRALREGDMPIAMDLNHRDKSDSGQNSASFLLIVRENGSIRRVPSASTLKPKEICDSKLISKEFNY